MQTIAFPLIELAVLIPLCGAALPILRPRISPPKTVALVVCGLVLAINLIEFFGVEFAHRDWPLLALRTNESPYKLVELGIDTLTSPILPLLATVYFLVALSTSKAKSNPLSFPLLMLHLGVIQYVLHVAGAWGILIGLSVTMLLGSCDLLRRGQPIRNQLLHAALISGLAIGGFALLRLDSTTSAMQPAGLSMLAVALMVRSGIWPFHTWLVAAFERGSLGLALLNSVSFLGCYGVLRLVLPAAFPALLEWIAIWAAASAVIAAGLALVQSNCRRFFGLMVISQTSLLMASIGQGNALSLTGALVAWLSIAISLTGFGLTIRNIEDRIGPIDLRRFYGLYQHTPSQALLFLFTGLASIGFPATSGLAAIDLILDDLGRSHPLIGSAILVTTTLNGIALLNAYFRMFGGPVHRTAIVMSATRSERLAAWVVILLILEGGIFPQLGITDRFQAIQKIMAARNGAEPLAPIASDAEPGD